MNLIVSDFVFMHNINISKFCYVIVKHNWEQDPLKFVIIYGKLFIIEFWCKYQGGQSYSNLYS